MKRFLALFLICLLLCGILTGCAATHAPNGSELTDESETSPTTPDNPDGTESPEQGPIYYGSTGEIGLDPVDQPDGAKSVLDYGVTPTPGADQSAALNLMFNNLSNGDTVFFPSGTYETSTVLVLSGKSNITLLGDHAEIVHTGAVGNALCATDNYSASGIFSFYNMNGINVRGLTVRYSNPTSISGVVTAYGNGSVTVQVTDGSALTGNECVMCIDTFDSDGTPDYRFEQYNTSTGFTTEKVSSDTLRISGGLYPNQNIVGAKVCLRLSLSSAFAFTIYNTTNLVVQDVTVRNSFNGAFLIEAYSKNATFRNVVVRSDNEGALMSVNADILHIAGLGGKLLIENCTFDSPGDDSLNIHTLAAKIDSISGNTLNIVHPGTSATITDSRQFKSGDTLTFYDPVTFACLGTATVSFVLSNKCIVNAIPSGIGAGTLVSNTSLHPSSVTVRHCTIRQSRARGLLLQSPNVTVEQCYFYGTALAAILIAPDITYWYEMQPSNDITLRQNKFEKCAGHAAGVILLAADHGGDPTSPSADYVTNIHRDITISANIFTACQSSAVMASCTTNLTFSGNTVDQVGTGNTTKHVLFVTQCDTVTVANNTVPTAASLIGNRNSVNIKED